MSTTTTTAAATAESVDDTGHFQRPTGIERAFSGFFNLLIGLGGGLAHNHVLEVPGRKSGKLYRTPVNLMEHDGVRYLVAPRGRTAWVRNAEAAGAVTLQRGRKRTRHALTGLPPLDRAPVLKEYLMRYAPTVKGYFTVAPDAPLEEFRRIAARHPVFVLTALEPPCEPPDAL